MAQKPPGGDNRYRVHRSTKFYVGELAVGTGGGTWRFTESAQRVVHLFPGRIEKVVYKTRFYALRSPSEMTEIISAHLALGGYVDISGREFGEDSKPFAPYEFIDITEPSEHERFKAIIQGRLSSRPS